MLPEFSKYDDSNQEEKYDDSNQEEIEFEVAQALRLNLLTQSGFDSLGVNPERLRKHFES